MISKIKILKTNETVDALIDSSADAAHLTDDKRIKFLSSHEYIVQYTGPDQNSATAHKETTTSVEMKTLCDFFDQPIKKITVKF